MSLVRFRPGPPNKAAPHGAEYAGLAHLVERHLAKVEVASSSLVTRSNKKEERLTGESSLPPPFFKSEVRGPHESEAFVGCDSEFELCPPLQ